ncbi:MAG: hypothetical protein ABL962_16985 [Fimbriimonadaceae bacterium]
MNILPSNSVNLCHTTGPYNSLVTLTITRDGMKISSVTLNPDRSARGPVTQKEIQPEGACIGIDLVLPPESTLVIRKLMKLSEELILDTAVVLSPVEGHAWPIKPLSHGCGTIDNSVSDLGCAHSGSANNSDQKQFC